MKQAGGGLRIFSLLAMTALFACLVGAASLLSFVQEHGRAYAATDGLNAAQAVNTQAAAPTVYYVAILGLDTWTESSGALHVPSSDMTAVVRIDTVSGTVNLLTIPRDTEYKHMTTYFKSAKNLKCNQAFHNGFLSYVPRVTSHNSANYGAAVKKGAAASCKMLSHILGINITAYVAVDQYTLQTIVNKLGGVKVDIPLSITNYRLYSNGKLYTINPDKNGVGKTGVTKLNGHDAMIAARARKPYATRNQLTNELQHYYKKLTDYKGDYPQLLLGHEVWDSKQKKMVVSYYDFSDDSIRQFLDRRMLVSLMDAGLSRSEGAVSFFWDVLVSEGLVWTNLSKTRVTTLANSLARHKKAHSLVIYGASALTPFEKLCYDNGKKQYLIPLDASNMKHYAKGSGMTESQQSYHTKKAHEMAVRNVKQVAAVVKELRSGKPMLSGWGDETIYGAQVGDTITLNRVVYKVTSATKVTTVNVPSRANLIIPSKVKLNNNKVFSVVGVGSNGLKSSNGVIYKGAGSGKVTVWSIPSGKSAFIPASVVLNGKKYPVVGIGSNGMKKAGGVTYKAVSASRVTVASGKNKLIPASVVLNGKKYSVSGIGSNGMKKSKGFTYRAVGAASVSVKKAPNKASVIVPATVKLNGKKYKVVSTYAKAFSGSCIKTVTLGKNVKKIAAYTFKGSKAKKLILKTTLLKKSTVKNSLKGSKIKTIKVSVAKKQKKKTLKRYEKCFTKKNAGWTIENRKIS